MIKTFLIFILFFSITNLYATLESKITLTQKEKLFIKNHPVVTLGSGESFAPYIFSRENGTIEGYDVDIANLVKEKTGLKIEFELGKYAQIQKKAYERKLDGLSAASINKERDKYYNYSSPYMKFTPLVIVNSTNPKKIFTKKDLVGKTVAVQKGNALFTKIASSLENVKIIYYDTIYDLIKAVVSKEVDFTILDDAAFYLAKEIGLEAFIEHAFVIGDTSDIVFCLRNDWPELTTIFNKVLNSISKQEMIQIRDKWFAKQIEIKKNFIFTSAEYDYLQSKKEIKMCFDPNWMPFTKFENGKRIGMSADIYELVSKNMPIPINEVRSENWTQSLEFAKERKCDIFDLAIETPSRREYLNFTSTFLDIPLIIVTTHDTAYIDNFKDIGKKLLAIPKGYAFIELIKQKYPYLNIVEVENIGTGLQMVKDEKVFAYIGTLASVAHVFKNNFTGELKVSGKFQENFQLGSAVRSDDRILLNILEKVIKSIPKEDIDNIISKWIHVKYEKRVDYALAWKVSSISFLILLIILYFYIKQRKLKDELETIFNNSKDGVAILDMDSNFLKVNPEFLILSSQNKSDLLKSSLLGFSSKEHTDAVKKALADIYKNGFIKNLEIEHIKENSELITINISMSLLSHPARILINVRDVTQRIQIQKQLHEKEELMIAQSRHAAMGEMISMIAHQWRQPLSVISMDANNTLLDIELDNIKIEVLREQMEGIVEQTQELSKTIDDFKSFFQPNRKKDEVLLRDVYNETISVIGKSLQNNNIEATNNISVDEKVFVFSRELLQVLLNLINNAKEALEANREKDRKIVTTISAQNKNIVISVCDNAGGVKDDVIKKVFDPYFSTKNEKNGTGLGLYMSKTIIEKHFNGLLSVSNTEDGACFEISFPY